MICQLTLQGLLINCINICKSNSKTKEKQLNSFIFLMHILIFSMKRAQLLTVAYIIAVVVNLKLEKDILRLVCGGQNQTVQTHAIYQ